ncbi:MAG: 50S ribosomal protein L15e [Candidatus Bathyarchaeia archaeon]
MSAYKYMGRAWRRVGESFVEALMKGMLVKWRREPSIKRVDKPTRLDKARMLGYKAKQGFVVVRVKVRKGGARKQRPRSGRRQKAMGVAKYTRAKSLKKIAQERAEKRYPNLKPLNTYWVWEDGKHAWFEVVMVDPSHPVIKSDKTVAKALGNPVQ